MKNYKTNIKLQKTSNFNYKLISNIYIIHYFINKGHKQVQL